MITSVLLSLPSQFTAHGTNSEMRVTRSVVGGGIEWSDRGSGLGARELGMLQKGRRGHTHTAAAARLLYTHLICSCSIVCGKQSGEENIYN